MDFLAIGSPNVEVEADGESRDQMEKQLQAIVDSIGQGLPPRTQTGCRPMM
jgi:hypothetical protein